MSLKNFVKNILNTIIRLTVSALSSKWAPWVITFLFVVNALWIALLYRFPLVFDEHFHFHTIEAFSNYFAPIIINQPPRYDELGSLTFGSASLYHYFLSFVYRIVELFTQDQAVQVIILRFINVLMAASGILLFFKFFKELGIKPYIVSVGMFIFAFIPILTNVAATINYDNVILPLTALFFIYGSRLILLKKPDILLILQLLNIGTLASLIKFTFLPLFAFALLFIAVILFKEAGSFKKLWAALRVGFKKIKNLKGLIWGLAFVILLLLAGFRYGVAVVLYHTPIPDCTLLMEQGRCEESPVFRINNSALETKQERGTKIPSNYVQNWVATMTNGYAVSGVNTIDKTEGGTSPPIYATMLTAGLSTGIILLIFMWRTLKLDRRYLFVISASLALMLATLLFNAMTYYQYRAELNVQPRYALTILPIILVFSVLAFNELFKGQKYIKLLLILALLFTTTQGGGLITHATISKDNWYWGNETVQSVQHNVRELLGPVVKEN
jgi:hypothetical protein